MTKREEIMRAVLAKLKTMSSVPAKRIVRSRTRPTRSVECPFVALEAGPDDIRRTSVPTEDHILKFSVMVYQTGLVPDEAADPIVEEIGNILKADMTLGGLVMDLEETGSVPDFEDGADPLVRVTIDYQVQYRNILT